MQAVGGRLDPSWSEGPVPPESNPSPRAHATASLLPASAAWGCPSTTPPAFVPGPGTPHHHPSACEVNGPLTLPPATSGALKPLREAQRSPRPARVAAGGRLSSCRRRLNMPSITETPQPPPSVSRRLCPRLLCHRDASILLIAATPFRLPHASPSSATRILASIPPRLLRVAAIALERPAPYLSRGGEEES